MSDTGRFTRSESDLEFTLGELLGKLNHIVPALAALEKFAGQLSSDQAAVKKDLELARKDIERFIEETKTRLESGQKHFYQNDQLIDRHEGRLKTVEDSVEKRGSRTWEFAMIIFSNIVTAALTMFAAYLLFKAGVKQ